MTFGAYRVFGCEGSTTADIMLAAMERAQADGMHVLNMSIGSAFQTWPQYPTAVGADALVDAGMHVVDVDRQQRRQRRLLGGCAGRRQQGARRGDFVNSHVSALTFNVNPGGRQVPYLQLADTQTAPTSGTTPQVVYVGRGCPQSGPPGTCRS